MRRLLLSLLVASVVTPAGVARAAWVVDAQGACVERWESSDLLRGPTAIANGPLLPIRTFAGGAEYAWNTPEWWPWQIAGLGPAVTIISGIAGAIEGVWWIGTGLADTLTGGYFGIAPERATELSIHPEVSRIIADADPSPTPTHDQCGRPLKPAASSSDLPSSK